MWALFFPRELTGRIYPDHRKYKVAAPGIARCLAPANFAMES